MMKGSKNKTRYVCQSCGTSSPKWVGRCTGCGEWNSFVEEKIPSAGTRRIASKPPGQPSWEPLFAESGSEKVEQKKRYRTGLTELDRTLGGGLVPDSFVLLGGDPGIGKSTLLLQLARGLASQGKLKVLYVSGEESTDQIRRRAKRLEVTGRDQILLSSETQLEAVLETVEELKPQILMMDSLQTFTSEALESAPGSVGQVREVACQLMKLAKTSGIAVWLVGHVTKDGAIAGPKIVEHMVDTVLYFEGEGTQNFRLLRTVKNRFGSTHELGVFEMRGDGLQEVTNPSSLFLTERKENPVGTSITACLEGTRPLLIELQSLVSPSYLNLPRRTSVGLEASRVSLLAAILEKHLDIPMGKFDLFFNVAGGLRLSEPASDLAAAAAIWSSSQNKALPADAVFFGEVGLTGEVRQVSQPDLRIEEARKLGFKTVVLPKRNLSRLQKSKKQESTSIRLCPIDRISDLSTIF